MTSKLEDLDYIYFSRRGLAYSRIDDFIWNIDF